MFLKSDKNSPKIETVVGAETELVGRPADALAGLRAELPGVVQRLRRRARRDTGQRGHVLDPGHADDP